PNEIVEPEAPLWEQTSHAAPGPEEEPIVPPFSVPPPLSTPPPFPSAPAYEAQPEPKAEAVSRSNWEQFMGVKLFAWVGGLALFLGVAFFVKYSFDNNLISPEIRAALSFLAGIGLLSGGLVMPRQNYAVLSQTLCATG